MSAGRVVGELVSVRKGSPLGSDFFAGKVLEIVAVEANTRTCIVQLPSDPTRRWLIDRDDLEGAEASVDPFCIPCGGFRGHKIGCPVARVMPWVTWRPEVEWYQRRSGP